MRRPFARLSVVVLALTLGLPAVAEPVQISYQGTTLNGNLELAGDKGLADGVVLMTHGTVGHAGMPLMADLQRLLRERGVNSLAITLSLGIDDRHGRLGCGTVQRHRHMAGMEEIGAWFDWLNRQDAKDVVLLGHSRGGNQTAWFAAESEHPAIAGVVLLAPMTWDPERAARTYARRHGTPLAPIYEKALAMENEGRGDALLEGVGFLHCDSARVAATTFVDYYIDDSRKHTPNLLPYIREPVLVVVGDGDDRVHGLIEDVRPLAGEAGIRLEVLPGADHAFGDEPRRRVADAVADFVVVE